MTLLYINYLRSTIAHILVCSVGVLCAFPVAAQQADGGIKGWVINSDHVALPSGTAYLLKASDSSIVKLSLTNDQGLFEFNSLKPGTYIINISVLGYHQRMLPPVTITGNAVIDLGIIALKKGADMKEVEVTGKANYVDVKPGKVVLNVSKSLLSAGGTALDVLSTAPGVQVDDNGTIKLKGKEVMVMINNKQVYLSADALTEMLRNTPSNTIAQVELISNPGAGYSAEGSGGIINIKLQRNKNEGINVSVNAGYGLTDINAEYGTRKKWSTGFNFDYNNKSISLFGGYAHADNISQRLSVSDRAVYAPSLKQVHTDYLNDLNDRGNPFRLGMDYNINPKQVVGFLVSGVYSNYDYTKTPIPLLM